MICYLKLTPLLKYGGPVEQDNLYFIHNIPELIPNSIEISNGIYWGGDFESTKRRL
jgi:putative transcriptional regulator